MSSEQTVMPSWVVASMRVACSIAQSVNCAAFDPASARGSIWSGGRRSRRIGATK